MRFHHGISGRVTKRTVVALLLALSGVFIALIDESSSSQAVAKTQGKIEATIFSYDGQDFVRTRTTLVTEDGKSAVNTKLDHDTPAYQALVQKHSYTGDATVFGKQYEANYAPLMGKDDRLTGALFVAVAK